MMSSVSPLARRAEEPEWPSPSLSPSAWRGVDFPRSYVTTTTTARPTKPRPHSFGSVLIDVSSAHLT
jgi:hypothetical protein